MLDFLGFGSLARVTLRERPRSFRVCLELFNLAVSSREVK
jgi:hypothetical protein